MRNVSHKSCRENQNSRFTFDPPPRKSCRLWENVEKNCRAGQATDGNMAKPHCMLYTLGYKHTLRESNTNCFSTVTKVAVTNLNVTLYGIVCNFVLSLLPPLMGRTSSGWWMNKYGGINGRGQSRFSETVRPGATQYTTRLTLTVTGRNRASAVRSGHLTSGAH